MSPWKRSAFDLVPLASKPAEPSIFWTRAHASGAIVAKTAPATSEGGESLLRFRGLPMGGRIAEVRLRAEVAGDYFRKGMLTLAGARVVRWGGNGRMEALSLEKEPGKDLSEIVLPVGKQLVYRAEHEGGVEVDGAFNYCVYLRHPHALQEGGASLLVYGVEVRGESESK